MNKKIAVELPQKSHINPEFLTDKNQIQFDCHPGISCFNICCKHADVSLAPYDIIRLKQHFGLTSTEFLAKHTVPYQIDGSGITGVKLKTSEQKHCLLLNDAGCSVYEDRPSACRYYPLGLMARKIKEEKAESFGYAKISDDYCKGHFEDKTISIATYRDEQKVADFDEHNAEWMKILLRKNSAGPAIGQVPELTLQLFFMCSFDVDRFRKFINSKNFRNTYVLDDDYFASLQDSDIKLLHFGYRLMNQVFFANNTIPLQPKTVDTRLKQRKHIIEARRQVEIKQYQDQQEQLKKEADEC